jgi:predicted phage tail protein
MKTRMMRFPAIVVLAYTAACGGGKSMPAAPSPLMAVAQAPAGFGVIAADASRCALAGDAVCFSTSRLHPSTVAAASAPTAPSGLTATASGSTVTLTWLAPTGTDPATSYTIEAGSAPGLVNLATFPTGNSATSYTTSGVGAGTYYVRVRATNSSGASAASNEATLVVGGTSGCTTPGAPASLAASVSGTTVVLSWTGSSGSPTSYIVEAGSSPGLSNLANGDLGGTSTTLTASGVGAGTYYIRIRGKNACGTGAASNEVVAVVGTTTVPTTISGTWTGQWTSFDPSSSPACGRDLNNVVMTLTQSGSSITGTMTWTIAQSFFSADVGKSFSQPLTGSASGNAVTFVLGGRYTGTATITSSAMSGTFTSGSCDPMPFSLTRQ